MKNLFVLPKPLQTCLLLLLLTTAPPGTRAFANDFSAYPSGSQSCLSTSADASGCTGDTGAEMNACLCANGGNFIYAVAACVAKASPSDLETVYATLQNNCEGTGVIITVGQAAFLAQASAATATTATATATATTTTSKTATATTTGSTTTDNTSTNSGIATATSGESSNNPTSTSGSSASDGDSSNLSTGAKIGIGAGIAIGGIACILGAIFLWIYNRRRRPSTKAYTQTGDGSPQPEEEYSSAFGSGVGDAPQELSSPYPPQSAIPLSASSGWAGGGTMNTVSSMGTQSLAGGLFYKPQDAQQTSQPLLEAAELGTEQPRGPVELYAPHQPPDAGSHLTPGFRAELPGGEVSPDRYQSPPGSHSPYSPPYERSHF